VDFRVGVFCSFLKFIFGLKQAKSGMVGDDLDCNGIAWDDCGSVGFGGRADSTDCGWLTLKHGSSHLGGKGNGLD
jgi:hypothetical protein